MESDLQKIICQNISRQNKISEKLRLTRSMPQGDFQSWLQQPLNQAQIKVIRTLESQRNSANPGRVIIMHASDPSVTQICEQYIYYLQFHSDKGADAALYFPNSKKRQQAKYALLNEINQKPENYGIDSKAIRRPSPNLINLTGNQTNRYLTPYNPHAIRGSYIRYALITEANSYTPRNNWQLEYYDKLYITYQALSVPMLSNTMLIMESNPISRTNRGFFNDTWQRTKEGKTLFTSVFVTWHENEHHRLRLTQPLDTFFRSLDSYEYYLWKHIGCTLEQINWYRHTKSRLPHPEQMQKHYPTTEQEATDTLTAAQHQAITAPSPASTLAIYPDTVPKSVSAKRKSFDQICIFENHNKLKIKNGRNFIIDKGTNRNRIKQIC